MKRFLLTALMALLATTAFAGEFLTAQTEPVEGQYIVTFRGNVRAAEAISEVAAIHGAAVGRVYEHALNGGVLSGLSVAQAQALANHPLVTRVEQDGIVRIGAVQTNPPSWGLDRIDQRALPLDSSYTYNFDGTGVDIYILDTGLRPTHVEFGGRATLAFDSIGDGQNGLDCNGHGTHVGGTAAGATFGVAKNANLHAVRVLDCGGSGTFSGVVAGVDFVTAEAQANPGALMIANMSLGGGGSQSLDDAVNNSVAAGVFYAVSAGNSNSDACNQSPARAADAHTVASTDILDNRSSFSSFGTCVDIFAPGTAITSAWHTSDTATNTISGTSMASPHIAGIGALVREEFPGLDGLGTGAEVNARATCNVVVNPGPGSPNLLSYSLSGTDPGCTTPPCAPKGASCVADNECCSNKCKGKRGNKSCK